MSGPVLRLVPVSSIRVGMTVHDFRTGECGTVGIVKSGEWMGDPVVDVWRSEGGWFRPFRVGSAVHVEV